MYKKDEERTLINAYYFEDARITLESIFEDDEDKVDKIMANIPLLTALGDKWDKYMIQGISDDLHEFITDNIEELIKEYGENSIGFG